MYALNKKQHKIQTPIRKQKKFWVFGAGLLLVLTLLALEITNRTYIFHKRKIVSTTIPSKSPVGSESSPTSNSSVPTGGTSSDTNTPSSDKKTTNQTVGSELIAPYGTFISNHRPGQNGSNLMESSQCTTTPGAKCYIKFTKGNVIKTLEEKSASNDGSIFWEWNTADAGLTSGNWVVTAVATLGNQTKTTTDQVELEVK